MVDRADQRCNAVGTASGSNLLSGKVDKISSLSSSIFPRMAQ